MRMSEDRLEKIAQDIVNRLAEDELIDITIDEEMLAERIGVVLIKDLLIEDMIQNEAVAWLRQNKSYIEPGTSEWSIALERKREDIAISKGYVLP